MRSAGSAICALLRIRLLPTAWADVLAGCALAGALSLSHALPRLILSSSLYLFGMVLNAIVDYEEDKVRFPDRPLPAGEVSLLQAKILAGLLLVTAAVAAIWLPPGIRLLGLALLAMIIFYNAVAKRMFPAGPIVMGGCRSLNLLLASNEFNRWFQDSIFLPNIPDDYPLLLPALALGIYVGLITCLNTMEGKSTADWKIQGTRGCMLLITTALSAYGLTWPGSNLCLATAVLAALIILIATALPWRFSGSTAMDETPVHRLLGGIYFMDAFFLALGNAPVLSGLCLLAGGFPWLAALLRRLLGRR